MTNKPNHEVDDQPNDENIKFFNLGVKHGLAKANKPKDKISTYTSNWTVAVNKPTTFGFHYRWYLPRFIYSWAMNDLRFINRNNKLIYKKAGYKPPAPESQEDVK